jgi:hypothetical protein
VPQPSGLRRLKPSGAARSANMAPALLNCGSPSVEVQAVIRRVLQGHQFKIFVIRQEKLAKSILGAKLGGYRELTLFRRRVARDVQDLHAIAPVLRHPPFSAD